jgi:hypothetical protein
MSSHSIFSLTIFSIQAAQIKCYHINLQDQDHNGKSKLRREPLKRIQVDGRTSWQQRLSFNHNNTKNEGGGEEETNNETADTTMPALEEAEWPAVVEEEVTTTKVTTRADDKVGQFEQGITFQY